MTEKHRHGFSVDAACSCGVMISELIREQAEALQSAEKRAEEAEALVKEHGDNLGSALTERHYLKEERDALKSRVDLLEDQLSQIENLDEKYDKATWIEQCESARELALKLGQERDALKAENEKLKTELAEADRA